MIEKLTFKDEVSNTPGGILSKLWRNILKDNNMNNSLGYLVTKYVDKTTTGTSKNSKRQTKNTLINNITAKEMSWKTFINLIFEFIHVKKFVISIKLTLPNGEESIHSITLNNGGADE